MYITVVVTEESSGFGDAAIRGVAAHATEPQKVPSVPQIIVVADDALAWFERSFGWSDADGTLHQAAIS